jgi:predicted dienelactone hydrolase
MLLFLVACAADPDDSAASVDVVAFLTQPGAWSVGHRTVEVVYTDAEGEARSLRTSAWYPSHATSGFPAQYLLGYTKAEGVFEDAAPADDGDFPAVAYSHGHQGYAEASSFLSEHLASHGYYVLAPDHTGDTSFDGGQRATDSYFDRPTDLSAVLDAFEAGDLVDAPQFDGKVVAMGHSFGGYTMFPVAGVPWDTAGITAACAAGESSSVCSAWADDLDGDSVPEWPARFEAGAGDPRIRALMAMAPGDYWLLGSENVGTLGVPALLMTGELDPERTADGAQYWADLAPLGARYVNVIGGAHNTFADVAGAMNDGQTLDPDEGHRLVRALALAFAEDALGRGDYAAVLDGSHVISEAAEFPE